MRRFVLAATSVAALACLGACSGGGSDGDAVAAVAPTESASPTSLDPFAWTNVSYKDYLDAADQIGLRPDVLVPEFGFDTGLDKLCHTSPEDFAAMRKTQLANTRNTDTYTAAQYLGDEVALRLGLACPQRMADWTATDDAHLEDADTSDDEVSEVTDEDLKRAEAEEAEATASPDDEDSPRPAPSTSSDTSSDDGSRTSTGGVTTGNSTPEH